MLLSCGDALIDFVPVKSADGRDAYVPAVGGSCLNIAVAMARLGALTGFVGGIANDMFGTMIADHLAASGVSLRYVRRSDDETTLAFVRFVGNEPHYAFYDETTAARLWTYRPDSIPFPAIEALHVGSTTLINEPVASEYLALFKAAKGRTTLSFDPNCRPTLTRDKAAYTARMAEFAKTADIVRMSDMDFDFLFGGNAFDARAEELLADGAALVIVTRGADGVIAWHRTAGRVEVAAPAVKVVDTIGAGDTFQGSLLVALKDAGRIARPALEAISRDELIAALAFGTRCAAITCSRAGANPPWRADV
ncbi:Sugar kinase, ribokinase [uncultured Pleomorphomonas sp.]|uniref:Sugar kinase, ribokinase n=2 Tax=Pleomorphomonas TaxID=261933 RepID=A0A212L1F8_9HYPH|nr:carbohydrate kinase [uncultured Pleomorphomonas sp.]SCM71370.1 Sugar kinase, ribokinase [uncultured Pleomorphomonas sp.]